MKEANGQRGVALRRNLALGGRREDGTPPGRWVGKPEHAAHGRGRGADLEDVVGGPVHAAVLDAHGQLVRGLAGQEVLADQRLGELGPFEVLQSQNQQTERGGATRDVTPRASPPESLPRRAPALPHCSPHDPRRAEGYVTGSLTLAGC